VVWWVGITEWSVIRLDNWGVIPGRDRIFLFATTCKLALNPPSLLSKGTDGSFLVGKVGENFSLTSYLTWMVWLINIFISTTIIIIIYLSLFIFNYIFIYLCWLCNWLLQLLSQHVKIKNWIELNYCICYWMNNECVSGNVKLDILHEGCCPVWQDGRHTCQYNLKSWSSEIKILINYSY
jgi:hypothetical protein